MDIFESTLYSALRINDVNSYLQNVTSLLAENSWVYNFRNIDIFIHNILEKIPYDWVDELIDISPEDLWKLPFGYQKDEWPESLKSFLIKCKKLGSSRFAPKKFQDTLRKDNLYLLKKLSDKKLYEVEIMSYLIKHVCQAMNCNTVIDIGSGLGYLDQALHVNFGICCIGLDAVPRYTLTARDRLKSDHCKYSVLHKTFKVKDSKECLDDFKLILKEAKELHCNCMTDNVAISEKNSASAIMASLHSCGDLSQDMMKLFCELDDLKAFVCIGCCYNKIDLSNFPMSNAAKTAVNSTQTIHPLWQPSIFGLRLAAHGTRSHPQSFPISQERERNMFYRSLLEYYTKKENIAWKHPKRHIRNTDLKNFNTYCSKMFEDHALNSNEKVLNDLNILYEQKLPMSHRIRILLVLQTMLQPLWEAFVVLDRVMYFKERNIHVEVLEMWSDSVSPRNLAICAYKR